MLFSPTFNLNSVTMTVNSRCELTRLLLDEPQSLVVGHLHKETVTDGHKHPG